MFCSYNKYPHVFIIGFFLCFLMTLLDSPSVQAQNLQDISSIKVDDLSDAQLQELVRRATESGLSESELLQMARVRGVPTAELEKLRKRLAELEITGAGTGRSTGEASKREPRRQMDFNEITQGL